MYTVMRNHYPCDEDMCYKSGNYFNTREEANALCEQLTAEYMASKKDYHKERPYYVLKIA